MWSRTLLVCAFVTAVTARAQNGGEFYFPDDERLQETQAQNTTTQKTTTAQKTTTQKLTTTQKTTTTQKLTTTQKTTTTKKIVEQKIETTSLPPGSKSLEMCRKYAKSVQVAVEGFVEFTIDTCPILEPLIVNGTLAKPREFPHMALIGFQSRIGIQWKCGGSLISERFVLSAAHCNPRNPIRVRLGDYNVNSKDDEASREAESVEFGISEIIEHPDYDKTYNDITLYKLDRNVVFSEYMRPICLHTTDEVPNRFGLITGWGSREFSGPQSDFLLKGNVSYTTAEECSPTLNVGPSEIKYDKIICAANFINGTDTCQGDSGGPLQYRLKDPYCMYSLVGITSFGVKCGYVEGQPKYPAVYTRVSHYVPWIEKFVWP